VDPVSLGIGILAIFAVVLITYYYRRLLLVQKKYDAAKDIVTGIVVNLNRRLEGQDVKIEGISQNVSVARAKTERLVDLFKQLEGRIGRLMIGVETALTASREVTRQAILTKERLNKLEEAQQEIKQQVKALDEKYRGLLPEEEGVVPFIKKPPSLAKIFETDQEVLQILLSQGPKSAPEIQKIIGKTREHTARMMKKLFEQGYVERDTSKIPYTYRINEKLRRVLEEELKKSEVTVEDKKTKTNT
jgi:predicted transcriptional regulator